MSNPYDELLEQLKQFIEQENRRYGFIDSAPAKATSRSPHFWRFDENLTGENSAKESFEKLEREIFDEATSKAAMELTKAEVAEIRLDMHKTFEKLFNRFSKIELAWILTQAAFQAVFNNNSGHTSREIERKIVLLEGGTSNLFKSLGDISGKN